jgi:peptidyl-prolyl cis-trans isomerase D
MLEQIREKQKIIIYVVAIVFILGMAPLGIRSLFVSKPISGKINGEKIDYVEYNETLQSSFYNVQMLLSNISTGESRISNIKEDNRDLNQEIRRLKHELNRAGSDSLKVSELNEEIESNESIVENNQNQLKQIEEQIKSLKQNVQQYQIDYNKYKQNNSISDEERLQLEDKNWADFIGQQIIRDEIASNHLSVSNSEYNDFVAENYNFLYSEDGTLNNDMLNMYLQQTGQTPTDFKESVHYQLKIQKLKDKVTADSISTMEEFEEDFVKKNSKRSAKVLAMPSYRFKVDSTAVTSQDIKEYYEEHKAEKYKNDEAVKIKVAQFEVKMSDDDKEIALDQINDIADQLKENPKDFATLAREFSQDPGSGSKGGNLGWFGHGRMVAKFDSVAFAMNKGEISEPFETQFGYHIVRVDDKKVENGEEQVKARHILIKPELSSETRLNIKDAAQDFASMVNADNFDTLAEEMNANLVTSPLVATDGTDFKNTGSEAYDKVAFMANSYFNYGFLSFVREGHVNSISPLYRDKEGNFAVVTIVDRQKDTYKELDEDLEKSIRRELEKEKKIEYANKFLADFNNKYSTADYAELVTDSLLAKSTLDTVRVKINFNEIANTSLPKDEVDTYMLKADYKAAKRSSLKGLRLVKANGTSYLVTLNKDGKKIVADIKMAVNEARNINKNSKYLTPISNSEKAIELLFEAPMNKFTAIEKTDEGNFIVKVIAEETPDMDKFASTKDDDFNKKVEQEKDSEFNKWYGQKLKDAVIIDQRFMAFE